MPITGFSIMGYAGVAVVVMSWLAASFSAPSRKRTVVEWIGACGLYLALLSLFVNLCLRANESGSTAALVAFGLLAALFGSGFVVSLVQTLLAARGPGRLSTPDATH